MASTSTLAGSVLAVILFNALFSCCYGLRHESDDMVREAVQGTSSTLTFSRRLLSASNDDQDPLSSKSVIIGGEALSPPCCTSWYPGRVDCFVRGPSSSVLHMIKKDGKHGDWIDIGGEVVGYVECVSRREGVIELMGQGMDNSLHWTLYDGKSWTAWKSLGGIIMEAPSCVVGMGNRVDCTGRGINNAVFFIRSLKEGAWQPIGRATWAFHSPIKCLQRQDRQYNCWGSSPKNIFRNIWRYTAGRWGGGDLNKFPGPVKSKPSACGFQDGVRADVFMLGSKNQLMHIYVDGYGGWRPFENLGGEFESTPHCISDNIDTIHCIGVGKNSALYRRTFEGGKWGEWVMGWESFLDGNYCLWSSVGEVSCYMRTFRKAIAEVVYQLK